jgi:hypothetical protein
MGRHHVPGTPLSAEADREGFLLGISTRENRRKMDVAQVSPGETGFGNDTHN